MKRILIILALLSIRAAATSCSPSSNAGMLDFKGGTDGAAPTTTTIAASASGLTGFNVAGNWAVNNAGSALTYSAANHLPFIGAPPCISGSAYIDSANLSFMYTADSSHVDYLSYTYPSSVAYSIAGAVFRTDIACGASTDNMDTFTIQNPGSGGETFATVIFDCDGSGHPRLTLEGSASQITILPNTEYQYAIQCQTSGTHKLMVFDMNRVQIGPTLTVGAANGQCLNLLVGEFLGGSHVAGTHNQWNHVRLCTGCTTADYPNAVLESAPYLSDGIISRPRAMDWTTSGIPGSNSGTLPDSTWTQLGSTLTAGSYAASTITASLSGCSNQYYLLGSGTFTITSWPILIPSNCVLRGSSGTKLVASGAGSQCGQVNAVVCIKSSDTSYTQTPPPNVCNWTGFYQQGSNQITLTNQAGTCLSAISTSTPTLLFLDQCDTGWTGSGKCTGSTVDNSQLYICVDQYNSTGPKGCSEDGGGTGRASGGDYHRNQLELHTATSVNGSTVAITPPLIMPNWASGQTPEVWIIQPAVNAGIENMEIDPNGAAQTCAESWNAYHVWRSGITCNNPSFTSFNNFEVSNWIDQSNYLYQNSSDSTGTNGMGFRNVVSGNGLTANNVIQQLNNPYFEDGLSVGNVIEANEIVATFTSSSSTFMNESGTHHATNYYSLWENNVVNEVQCDDIHGTCAFATLYRNLITGWQSLPAFPQVNNTNSVGMYPYSRYHNIAGNSLGTVGYHNAYDANSATSIYFMGRSFGGSPTIPADALTDSTTLKWANYDIKTAAKRFCGNSSDTGWSTTCGSASEVPTGASIYPSSLPTLGDTGAGQSAMPPSLFFASQPTWWQSHAWPAIGPDVSSGSVGICAGTLNTVGHFSGMPASSSGQCTGTSLTASAWGGTVSMIPAFDCALNVMSMPVDGSGSILSFSATGCYSSTPTASTPTFSPVAGTYSGAQSVTITCSTGPTACQNTTGNPATNGTTGCSVGTLVSGTVSVPSSETLYAVCGGTGYIDSAIGSAAYTINAASVPAPATNMILVAQAPKIPLQWDASVTPGVQYRIFRSTGDAYVKVKSGISATHWTDEDVITGQDYYYEVQAFKPNCAKNCSSSFSNQVSTVCCQ